MAAIDLNERAKKVAELAALTANIQKQLTEAENIADAFGIEFVMRLAGRRNTYVPTRPDGVTEEDIEGTDWVESESDDGYYGTVTGWTNSSTYC